MTTSTYIPLPHAKNVRSFISAHKRWNNKCVALRNAETTFGTDSAEFRTAFAAWSKGRIPSKRAKGWAYDGAAALARYIEQTTGNVLPRAQTVADMEATLLAFDATQA